MQTKSDSNPVLENKSRLSFLIFMSKTFQLSFSRISRLSSDLPAFAIYARVCMNYEFTNNNNMHFVTEN